MGFWKNWFGDRREEEPPAVQDEKPEKNDMYNVNQIFRMKLRSNGDAEIEIGLPGDYYQIMIVKPSGIQQMIDELEKILRASKALTEKLENKDV